MGSRGVVKTVCTEHLEGEFDRSWIDTGCSIPVPALLKMYEIAHNDRRRFRPISRTGGRGDHASDSVG